MDKVTSEAKSKQAEDENFFLECEKHMSFWLLIFVGAFMAPIPTL